MLQNEHLVAEIGVDTAENEPRKGLKNCTIEKAPVVTKASWKRTPKSLELELSFSDLRNRIAQSTSNVLFYPRGDRGLHKRSRCTQALRNPGLLSRRSAKTVIRKPLHTAFPYLHVETVSAVSMPLRPTPGKENESAVR